MGSLFSGIGGLDLGLEWAGLGPTVWQVEQDHYCRAVLAKHWPYADRSVTDVRAVAASSLSRPRLLIGGFPCQDVSGAGKGAGLAGERSGLWFVFRDIVEAFRPEGVIVENVASGKKRWLCQVRSDMQALGYRTRAVQVSAADVGAPHLRERVFVLALADSDGMRRLQPQGGEPEQRGWVGHGGSLGDTSGSGLARWPIESSDSGAQLQAVERASHRVGVAYAEREGWDERAGSCGNGGGGTEPADRRVADADTKRRDAGRHGAGEVLGDRPKAATVCEPAHGDAESGLGGGAARLSAGLDGHRWPAPRGAEQYPWEPPRSVQGKQPHRRPRLKALGNGVVPQCAYVAGLVFREWADWSIAA